MYNYIRCPGTDLVLYKVPGYFWNSVDNNRNAADPLVDVDDKAAEM